MKIAVTSQNFKSVTNHAGHARRYIIFEVGDDNKPVEVECLDLPKEMAFREFDDSGEHPVDVAGVIISQSFGGGFARRMKRRGIIASITKKDDPVEAVLDYLECGQCLPDDGSGVDMNNPCDCHCTCG